MLDGSDDSLSNTASSSCVLIDSVLFRYNVVLVLRVWFVCTPRCFDRRVFLSDHEHGREEEEMRWMKT